MEYRKVIDRQRHLENFAVFYNAVLQPIVRFVLGLEKRSLPAGSSSERLAFLVLELISNTAGSGICEESAKRSASILGSIGATAIFIENDNITQQPE